MPIDAEIVILNPEWIWRFLEGDRLSLEYTAPKLSTIERCYNSLNGSALELRTFSKLSRNHIHESSANKCGVLVVVSLFKLLKVCLHSCCQSVLLHFQRSLMMNLDLFTLFFLCVYFFIQEST